jgi:3-oxoadipate CoA-transferase alpha subunit
MSRSDMPSPFDELYRRGLVELELVPQGIIAERLHAGAAGVPTFYVAAGSDMQLGEGREMRTFDGQVCLLERAIRGDFALIHAHTADRYGNLTYRLSSKNFNPVMAMAADHVLCEVEQIVEVGEIDPDRVDTPGLCVDALIPLQGEVGSIGPGHTR